jgi:hypothetical protein
VTFQKFEVKRDSTEDILLRTLKHYPNITKSMISIHVRPGHDDWDSELERLITEGKIVRDLVLRDTGRASVIYHLPIPQVEIGSDVSDDVITDN